MSPSLERVCPNCGRKMIWTFHEHVFGYHLVWSASSHCDYCGLMQEEDDSGPLPSSLRVIVLAEEGEWELKIEETGISRVLILKCLRQALGLTLVQTAKFKFLIPGVVASGTRAEMERLRSIFVGEGIEAVNVQAKPPEN